MKKDQLRNRVFVALLMLLLFGSLLRINAASPRVDVHALSAQTALPDQLVLLEGGTLKKNQLGGESLYFTLEWQDGGCLFLPKAGGCTLLVNGTAWDDLQDGKLRLFQFQDAPAPDGRYEVEICISGKTLDRYGRCLYLGPLAAVSACVSSQIVSRFMVTGICLCVMLFSALLYTWKRSEKYLFWLALYAACMLLRTQDALGIGLFIGTENPLFEALDNFVVSSDVFRLIYLILSAWLNYQVMRRFLSVRLFGHSILCYIVSAAVLLTVGKACFGHNLFWEILYFTVFYTCQIVCIQKDPELPTIERHTLSVAWVLTAVFQYFHILTSHGVIPPGTVGLQFHIPPIVSCIFPVAFFLIACRRFATKFQEADDLNTHLEAAVAEKTQEQSLFIRSMLHNLKTPLFSLTGYSDMAAASLEDPEQAQHYLAKVSDKAQYVSRLLDRLFLLTQMDAQQVVFQQVPVNLTGLLETIAETTRLKGKEKDIRVSLTAQPDAYCVGDPLYLQQAFQNITDNAVEHTHPGGSLWLSLEGTVDQWVLAFADNGCGIAIEDLPRIFDRYYSNHHGRRSSSGLGLTIAKEIITHHGGSIAVTSQPEKGTVFTVKLPRPDETQAPSIF